MPLTLNNFIGFETGGLEEASASGGSPTADSIIVRTGSYALELNASDQYDISPFESVSDAGDSQIIGFAFRAAVTSPTVDVDFLQAMEGGTAVLRLRWEATSADLILVDAAGAEVDTIVNPFTDTDLWYYVEVIWQHLNSGAAEVDIDETSSGLSVTTTDFSGGGTFDTYRFDNPASGPDIYIDDVYMMSDATDTGDFLGPEVEVLGAFQNTDEDDTDQGSTLDQATWAVAGETPVDDEVVGGRAGYTAGGAESGYTICDEGNRDGPDLLITGTSKGAKWIHRLSRGSGSGTVHTTVWGKNVATNTTTVTVASALGNFFEISENALYMPNANTDSFAQGMAKATGGREIYSSEMWSFLLHVLPSLSTTLADLNFPDQNYYLGPFSV